MDEGQIYPGQRVRVGSAISSAGFLIAKRFLEARETGRTGVVHSWVGGHGGDVWYVVHDARGSESFFERVEIKRLCEQLAEGSDHPAFAELWLQAKRAGVWSGEDVGVYGFWELDAIEVR